MASGRPQAQEARHFKLLPELGKAGGDYGYRECRFCRAAHDNALTTTPPKVIIGRARNYASHLINCAHYQAAQAPPASPRLNTTPVVAREPSPALSFAVTPRATSQSVASRTRSQQAAVPPPRPSTRPAGHPRARRSLVLDKQSSPGHKRRKPVSAKKMKKQKRVFTKSEIKQLECSIIEAHADNHLPDRLVESCSIRRVLELLCPEVSDILPSRRTLGKRVLQYHASRCKEMNKEALKSVVTTTGGWINLLSDVWMNICKEHLLGCQLSLFGVLLTYALLAAGDEHHGVAIAKQLEQVLEQVQLDQWRVGAIVTDNAGQCARARRILAIRWPHTVFLFCFAYDVNNLVKAVLRSSFKAVAARAATAVKIVNTSSSKWLPRARQMMKKCYGKTLALRTLCETRWNSMQGCCASLLRVQSALQMFYRRYNSYEDFPAHLRAFGDPLFWDEPKEAEAVIAPLVYASYRLPKDENTVGDVLLSFRDIHKGFKQHITCRDTLVGCIESRWAQSEQPLFVLGFALHPLYAKIARKTPHTSVSGIGALCKIAVYYYRRLFTTEDIGQIRRDMLTWMKGRFTRTKPSEFIGATWEYWESVAAERPQSFLPKLAMRVLSIAVNTATCERRF